MGKLFVLYKMSMVPVGKMKIAELERRSGARRSAIHHYLNLGLLPPCHVAGPKLHLFGEEHLAALIEIRRLRRGGLSLREILPRVMKMASAATERAPANRPGATKASGDRKGVAERILGTATSMFVRVGYERMRMDDLAAALRISKPTIYRHFPSKQELFLRCVHAVRFTLVSPDERKRSERRGAAAHGDDRIRLVLQNFEAYSGLTRILTTLAHGPDVALRRRAQAELHAMITNVEPFLRQGQAAGRITPLNSELLAYMLWGALMAVGDRMLQDDQHSLDSVIAAYKAFIERGMLLRAT